MGLRTVEEYRAGLRDGRRVFVEGRRVEDVTADPMLAITVGHSAEVFALAARPELRDLFVFHDPDLGEPASAYFRIPRTAAELRARGDLIEENTRQQRSTFNITKAVGTDALLALLVVAAEVDRELGPRYLDRVRRYRDACTRRDVTMALAQTDVKGDRGLRPSQQVDPDLYVRVVRRTADGIVVRGAKAHTTAGPVVDELIVIPTRALGEEDREYAVAFATPLNAPGLTMICRPIVTEAASTFDHPVSRRNIEIESLTVFEDVFVPWERVFLCGEWQFAGRLATTFATFHRYTAVSYKPPLGELFCGAAALAAEYHGLERAGTIRGKIARLAMYPALIRAARLTAASECRFAEGIAVPNGVYSNAGKFYFASQFHDAVALLQDVAGGLVITGPTEADLRHPEAGPLLEKYLAGAKGVSGRQRLALMHLIRDLTASDFGGYNLVVTLHGEGSMDAQLLGAYREADLEGHKALVRRAIEP
ncbi:MAG: 4-hydroxybutyryl-CoA dehydratase [Candidatus Rokubacteria bacterium]|nr:4-hydroxybutyryl-CoA dehydratase [Candidatus Rokubacteria bacterium]